MPAEQDLNGGPGRRDIVVVGASAGGVEALLRLVPALPDQMQAAIFVVLHVLSTGTSVLPGILSRHCAMEAVHPEDETPIKYGCIYVAPPDHHLLLEDGHVLVRRGPRENGHRPAIDPLFRTAARAYGSRVVGVVLSGVLDDGSSGLVSVKEHGGLAIAQDPEDALYPFMPQSAIAVAGPDLVLPVPEIARTLVKLANEPLRKSGARRWTRELPMAGPETEGQPGSGSENPQPGEPSGFTCPECNGALWEAEEGGILRFRCRVGHAYSPESLMADQAQAVEAALWSGLRALEERAALTRRLVDRLRREGRKRSTARFERQASELDQQAAQVRSVLDTIGATAASDPAGAEIAAG